MERDDPVPEVTKTSGEGTTVDEVTLFEPGQACLSGPGQPSLLGARSGVRQLVDGRAPTGPAPSLGQLRQWREELLPIFERYGASGLRVFGSVARGDERTDSDVDFLVCMEAGRSLFDLGE